MPAASVAAKGSSLVPAGMCSGCAQTARGCRRDPVRPLKTAHPLGHSVGDTVRSLVELGCVGDLRWSNKGRCRPLLDRRRRSPVVVGSDRVCSGRRQVAANSSFFRCFPLSASTCALSPPPLEFTVGAAHRIPAPPHSCPTAFLPHRIRAPPHSWQYGKRQARYSRNSRRSSVARPHGKRSHGHGYISRVVEMSYANESWRATSPAVSCGNGPWCVQYASGRPL